MYNTLWPPLMHVQHLTQVKALVCRMQSVAHMCTRWRGGCAAGGKCGRPVLVALAVVALAVLQLFNSGNAATATNCQWEASRQFTRLVAVQIIPFEIRHPLRVT